MEDMLFFHTLDFTLAMTQPWGEVDFESIQRLADIQENDVHTALGWLAKEDKICADEDLRFKLK